jgi:hypothetical protein
MGNRVLFVLTLVVQNCYDGMESCAVVAYDEGEARALASKAHGDEGPDVWLDVKRSSCKMIDMHSSSRVLIRDVMEG